jgi:hypothetical protein
MSPGEECKGVDHDMLVPKIKEGPFTNLQETQETCETLRIAFTRDSSHILLEYKWISLSLEVTYVINVSKQRKSMKRKLNNLGPSISFDLWDY